MVALILILLDPNQSSVGFSLGAFLHTVHGAFPFTSGSIQFDPATGKAGGELRVDLARGTTGLGPRDAVMRNRVLETGTYPEAMFLPESIVGRLNPAGTSTVDIRGKLSFHGATHDWTFRTAVTVAGDRVTATARSTIPYVAWGLHNPSTFMLHVKDDVDLEIHGTGRISTSAP